MKVRDIRKKFQRNHTDMMRIKPHVMAEEELTVKLKPKPVKNRRMLIKLFTITMQSEYYYF